MAAQQRANAVLRGLLGDRADAIYELDDPAAAAIVVPEPWDPWAE